MRQFLQADFDEIISHANVGRRLKSELKFNASIAEIDDWEEREMLPIYDRAKKNGVLVIEIAGEIFAVQFEIKSRVAAKSGALKSVICDFCKIWLSGSRAAVISFILDPRSPNSTSFLCCKDLNCSANAREKTKAFVVSRTQLREDISPEDRLKRFQENLLKLIENLKLAPLRLEK